MIQWQTEDIIRKKAKSIRECQQHYEHLCKKLKVLFIVEAREIKGRIKGTDPKCQNNANLINKQEQTRVKIR